MPTATNKKNILILGVGNLLLRDEGVGIHVVRALEHDSGNGNALPPHVRTLDGGTGGFHLLGELQGSERVILIDATLDEKPPGTVTVTEPRHATDYPALLSAHEIGLRDMIEAMMISGNVPRIHLITISAADISEIGMDLSPEVKAAIPGVIDAIKALVHE